MNIVYQRAVELLEADIHDELVALEPHAGTCFGFNNVAAFVWRKLEQPRTFDELRADLLATYDVDEAQCESELKELLAEMQGEGLVAASAA